MSRGNNVKLIASDLNSYFLRIPIVLIKYFFTTKKNIDCICIGFVAQPIFFFIRNAKKQIISDMMTSLYETLCSDRKTISGNSLLGRMAYWFDEITCKGSSMVIVDTKAHGEYIQATFHCEPDKLNVIYIAAEEEVFYPRDPENKKTNKFNVFYYGMVFPLQGIDYILRAAKILEEDDDIQFTLVGPIERVYGSLINELKPKNVKFIPWLNYSEFPNYIGLADVCLGGHFGNTEKAKRVIGGKTYQFVSMKKPVILGDNPANREIFTQNFDCLMVEMGNERALAEAIKTLKADPQLSIKIASNGYETYRKLIKL